MRSRYDLAQNATVRGEDGTFYKDIFTIPTQKFRLTESQNLAYITEKDRERIDLFMFNQYSYAEFDDLILWLNNKGLIYDLEIGTELELPTREDLENFYYTFRK